VGATAFARSDFRGFNSTTNNPVIFAHIGGDNLPTPLYSSRHFPVNIEDVLSVVNPLTPLTRLAAVLLLLPLLFKRSAAPVQS
jgi:hypothetical protein